MFGPVMGRVTKQTARYAADQILTPLQPQRCPLVCPVGGCAFARTDERMDSDRSGNCDRGDDDEGQEYVCQDFFRCFVGSASKQGGSPNQVAADPTESPVSIRATAVCDNSDFPAKGRSGECELWGLPV